MNLLGGWTIDRTVSNYDKAIFYQAIGYPLKVTYEPIAVAKQLVNGMNYRFITIVTSNDTGMSYFAVVEIYKPLNEKAYVTGIYAIQD